MKCLFNHKSLSFFLCVLSMVFTFFVGIVDSALAMGKKRKKDTSSVDGNYKIAIEIRHIRDRYLELPDENEMKRSFGENLRLKLLTKLAQTKKFIILMPPKESKFFKESFALTPEKSEEISIGDPDPVLNYEPPIASTVINIDINELTFTTGSRGERVQYGFKKEWENAYSGGLDAKFQNEFPARSVDFEKNWFENIFNDYGGYWTGLDLGHQFNFDVLFLGANFKYAKYRSTMGEHIEFLNRVGESHSKDLMVHGKGFYYDLSGHLMVEGVDYKLGILVARKTAMKNAFDAIIEKSSDNIITSLMQTQVLAKVISNWNGDTYISIGSDYNIKPGQRFYDLSQLEEGKMPCELTVEQVFRSVSKVKLTGALPNVGDLVTSLRLGESVPKPSKIGISPSALLAQGLSKPISEQLELSELNFEDIPKELFKYKQNAFVRWALGLKQLVTLPYRIWRYFQFDQKYNGAPLGQSISFSQAQKTARKSWVHRFIKTEKAWQKLGLGSKNTIIAVIDSGIDYNHKALNRNIFWSELWQAPGWDFYSGDRRPYDDHAHGTEVASVIAGGSDEIIGVAPQVTLLPLKVFSPYGETSSAAIYSAFEAAVLAGAKIIVLGWGTPKYSRALEDGLRLAQSRDILVVAAAGDGGQDLLSRPYYPASFGGHQSNHSLLVTVAGIDSMGELSNTFGLYSNFGEGVIDVTAPGEDILSANPRNQYRNATHTGLASGIVAAAAGLVLSYCPKIEALKLKDLLTRSYDELNQGRWLDLEVMAQLVDSYCL